MLTIKIPQFPQKLQIHLFNNVKNSAKIKSLILSGADTHNFAFINADVIISKEQLLSSCYRTLLEYNGGKIRTRGVHSEILFCLGASGNIIDSLTRFGIKEECNRIIIIKVVDDEKDSEYNLETVVEGEEQVLEDSFLRAGVDFKQLQKIYKLQPSVSGMDKNTLCNEDWALMINKIVNCIQLRGC